MMNDQQWTEVINTLTNLHTQLSQIPVESDWYLKSQQFIKTVRAMMAEAFDMGSPLTGKVIKEQRTKGKVGRPSMPYRLTLKDARALPSLMTHLVHNYYVSDKRKMVVNSVEYAPSRFFACLYAALEEYGLATCDNLRGYWDYMDELKPKLQEEGYDFTLAYQAVHNEIRSWSEKYALEKQSPRNILSDPCSGSRQYEPLRVYNISVYQIADRSRVSEFNMLRNLYKVVVGLLIEIGIIKQKQLD